MQNLIPSLKKESIQRDIFEAFQLGKMEYAEFTLKWFERKGFACESSFVSGQCGDFSFVDPRSSVQFGDDQFDKIFESNIKFLKCCLNVTYDSNAHEKFYMPYFQAVNGHEIMKSINNIATSERLGKAAANLLQVSSVRLYQTAIFVKNESSINTNTEWHQDLHMVPVDVSVGGYLTFWCPLSPLHHSRGDSLLWFAEGSHRDIARYHW
jgi:hypothetical protein